MSWDRQITIKSKDELKLMREAGVINAEALKAAAAACVPGATTYDVNAAAEKVHHHYGVTSPFRGVNAGPIPFPANTCTSVNNILVHGIPSKKHVLKEGDIVTVDCGTTYKGYVADSAITIPVGKISEAAEKLIQVTESSLYEGIQKMRVGFHTGDVSAAIQEYVESRGYFLTKQYTGHGVGRQMWEAPQVPNYGIAGQGVRLKAGIVIAIEPMVLVGTEKTKVLNDGWAVSSADNSLTAHYEHSIAVTEEGPMVLTLDADGNPPLTSIGMTGERLSRELSLGL